MRILPLLLSLATTSAFAQLGAPYAPMAQGFERTFSLGIQSYAPSLTGHFSGIQDGQPILVDLNADLGLGKDRSSKGLFLDYQGPQFAFQLSNGSAEYRGNQAVGRDIAFNGTTFPMSTTVLSHVKIATVDGTLTIKFVQDAGTYLGLDLGAQVWTVDLDATSDPSVSPVLSASTRITAPIPQLGLSLGSRDLNGAMESKAYVHYLGWKGARYTLIGLDLRVYPVSWFGLRAFYEGGTFNVPQGSIKNDLELKLDRKGIGFGAVVRF